MYVCPNCGAPLEYKFALFCEYCGVFLGKNNDGVGHHSTPSVLIINSRYKYLQNNVERITKNRFVSFKNNCDSYTIESKLFYCNNGELARITIPFWQIKYQNDGRSEKLLMGISSNHPATRMALMIDEDIINLTLHNQENKTVWFVLPMDVLLHLCKARDVEISTDVKIDAKAQYNEFPIFASRFYNAAFDKMKFVYSLNVKMITDE